jgi:serine-type D-Ala-D-Ala carboxypeptidase (penicillin-binding protein 5/6)
MKRFVFLLFFITGFPLTLFGQSFDQDNVAELLLEPTTGRVLYEKNAHQPFPVASMTKMMTMLIVMEAVKDGSLTLDAPVLVSARASKQGGSQVYLKEGESFPVRDMLAATMIHSANDAATALAEKIAGSVEAFVPLMNERAVALGMKESHFYSPHGLPAEKGQQDDLMSAWDAARLGMELMKYPLMQQDAAIQTAPFRNGVFTMYNPNHLLRMFPGANGIKTGYHVKAGFCVTGSAQRGDMKLIVVVMGAKMPGNDFKEATRLLAEGFANWRWVYGAKKGSRAALPAIIEKGEVSTVPVVAAADAKLLVQRGQQQGITAEVVSSNAEAPIHAGQPVGFIVVKQNGKPAARVAALAAGNVARIPWWKAWWPF